MFVAFALFGFLNGLNSINDAPKDIALLHVASGISLFAGFVALVFPWRRASKQVFEVLLPLCCLDIIVLAYAAGPAHGDLTLLFTFVIVFAAYFFSWRAVLGQLLLIAVLLVARFVITGSHEFPASEIVRLAMLIPAYVMIAWLVLYLRRDVDEREKRLKSVGELLELPLDDVAPVS